MNKRNNRLFVYTGSLSNRCLDRYAGKTINNLLSTGGSAPQVSGRNDVRPADGLLAVRRRDRPGDLQEHHPRPGRLSGRAVRGRVGPG